MEIFERGIYAKLGVRAGLNKLDTPINGHFFLGKAFSMGFGY
jgi:hypothetical protein